VKFPRLRALVEQAQTPTLYGIGHQMEVDSGAGRDRQVTPRQLLARLGSTHHLRSPQRRQRYGEEFHRPWIDHRPTGHPEETECLRVAATGHSPIPIRCGLSA